MIILKSRREIDIMREANQIVAETHAFLSEKIKPGISTAELDQLADEFIRSRGAVPSFKGYQGFPTAVCISINEEVVHGIPAEHRFLEDGDIVSVDIGTFYEGFNGDAARTYAVGSISENASKLLKITEESLLKGLEKAVIGNRLFDISHAVQEYVEKNGFSVVRDYVGHGIGRDMHEDPQIPNFGPAGKGPKLKEGMTLAVEPMVNIGSYEVKTLEDDWTVVTKDRSLSAHFEHTIAITKAGVEILSKL
ncbi:methionine aminopeptidase, type I [Halanaerobium congolense]|jgi:methionyl aminopeptidase|uniref:Methionine aminopeptidase n=1 Tax=Halanaerobium congolense TaxID=54121 RepID=A0A1G7HMV9_9FIRM|nr:type I methionyl aminopeptidase [Halanaerobium congolense]PUU92883.1 MAG: methionyl aminopeptidase [Halanaerobium sp.]PTX15539.1 methionine aminopeptidase type I [Halanaerobium congolense]SDF01743.1 methionine aminopeptidase, type I [Halanaerobium congolense]SDI88361.1 methionine aminopeptidase, type I [Halanaerobium congolense]SES62682.1 methionine aminopeptidase, type I [Halanaerobium congolense]